MSTDPTPNARSSTGRGFVPTSHSKTYALIDPTQHNFAGRNILITGASKGIGRATAISYARAGASGLALGARSDLSETTAAALAAAKDAGRPAPKIVQLKVDVNDEASVKAAADATRTALEHLDVIINNAGALEKWEPIATSDSAQWISTFSTNTIGLYLVTRYFWALLLGSPHADRHIINLSSIGQNGLSKGAAAYQVSKLAVARLTEFMAAEGAPDGITVLCVHPGGVPSELALRMPDWMHGVLNDEPDLAGDAMVFLTAESRQWLAGRFVSCNWDMGEVLALREEIEKGDLLKVRMAVGFEPTK